MEAATDASPRSQSTQSTPSDSTAADGAAPRDIVLLGSTGSIGTQAADIIRRNPDRFRLVGLAAGGGTRTCWPARRWSSGSRSSAVASERPRRTCSWRLRRGGQARVRAPAAPLPKVLAGPDAVAEVAAWPCDVVLNAVTGAARAWPPRWPR